MIHFDVHMLHGEHNSLHKFTNLLHDSLHCFKLSASSPSLILGGALRAIPNYHAHAVPQSSCPKASSSSEAS